VDAGLVAPVAEPDAEAAAEAFDADADPGRGEAGTNGTGTSESDAFGPMPVGAAGTVAAGAVAGGSPVAVTCDAADAFGEEAPSPTPRLAPPAEPASAGVEPVVAAGLAERARSALVESVWALTPPVSVEEPAFAPAVAAGVSTGVVSIALVLTGLVSVDVVTVACPEVAV
jgi:hypothetical protein